MVVAVVPVVEPVVPPVVVLVVPVVEPVVVVLVEVVELVGGVSSFFLQEKTNKKVRRRTDAMRSRLFMCFGIKG